MIRLIRLPRSRKCWKCQLAHLLNSNRLLKIDGVIMSMMRNLKSVNFNRFFRTAKGYLSEIISRDGILTTKRSRYFSAAILDGVFILFILFNAVISAQKFFSPLVSPLRPLQAGKGGYEVFGFAPYWTFDKLDNVNFNVL